MFSITITKCYFNIFSNLYLTSFNKGDKSIKIMLASLTMFSISNSLNLCLNSLMLLWMVFSRLWENYKMEKMENGMCVFLNTKKIV